MAEETVDSFLHSLVEDHGMDGVEILQRDGQCVREVFRPELDIPTYSHLSAQLTAASETVLPQLRVGGKKYAVTSSGQDRRVVVVDTNDNLILAALTASDQPTERVVRLLEGAAPRVNELLANGRRRRSAT